jgi:hypothetical protein
MEGGVKTIKMSMADFKREHHELLDVLRNPTKEKLEREYAKQLAEMNKTVKGAGVEDVPSEEEPTLYDAINLMVDFFDALNEAKEKGVYSSGEEVPVQDEEEREKLFGALDYIREYTGKYDLMDIPLKNLLYNDTVRIPKLIEPFKQLQKELKTRRERKQPTKKEKMMFEPTMSRGSGEPSAELMMPEKMYLKKAKAKAKAAGYDPKMLMMADDGKHKLDYDGVKFGALGYGDHIIYSYLEKLGEVEKGLASKKRRVFRKSHGAMKDSGKFSANQLAINILW